MPDADELRALQRELESRAGFRRHRESVLAGAAARERGPKDWFDGPDALEPDLWWLVVESPESTAAPARVWAGADAAACEDARGRYGAWIARRDGGSLVVVRSKTGVAAGFSDGETVLIATPGGWWQRGVLEHEGGRLVGVAWSQGRGDGRWTPEDRHEIAYADDGAPAAVTMHYKDHGVPLRATLFERRVEPPSPEQARAALADALRAELAAPGVVGARLWYELDEVGVTAAYAGFDRAATLDELLGPPRGPGLELPPLVEAHQRRLLEQERYDELQELALGIAREINAELEREHGPEGPVLLAFPYLVGPDAGDAAAVLTPAQRASWESRGWWSALELASSR